MVNPMDEKKDSLNQTESQDKSVKTGKEKANEADVPASVKNMPETENLEDAEEVDVVKAAGELAAAYAALEEESECLRKSKTELEAAKEELEYKLLRLSADFDNFRKRTNHEKEQWRSEIVTDVVADLFPVLDNFSLAINMIKKDVNASKHLTGVEMIYRQFSEVLNSKGIEQISALNEVFDPKWHEAISNEDVAEKEKDGIVIDVFQPGYRIGEKLIRPAMVRVGRYKEEI